MSKPSFNKLYREWKKVSGPEHHIAALIKSPLVDDYVKRVLRTEAARLNKISEPLRLAAANFNFKHE